jgi:hypothetical protein
MQKQKHSSKTNKNLVYSEELMCLLHITADYALCGRNSKVLGLLHITTDYSLCGRNSKVLVYSVLYFE